jgi:superoxide dismutase, Cu-Zn family
MPFATGALFALILDPMDAISSYLAKEKAMPGRNKIRFTRIPLAAALLMLGACMQEQGTAHAPERDKQIDATAQMRNADGDRLADVHFEQLVGGLALWVDFTDLPAGEHGLHIHEVGSCAADDFSSAGDHFNPEGAAHGLDSEGGPHVGDLPNIAVGADGNARVRLLLPGVVLSDDGSGRPALLGGEGTALVIHANPDDYRSDPAGDAGDRIACGVIMKPQ